MILDEIAESTRKRVEEQKKTITPEEMVKMALEASGRDKREKFLFEKALKKPGISFICEVKKASPSKGLIAEHFPYLEIAKEYEAAGADAISVLTEPEFFLGDSRYLKEIAETVEIPVLRKDFTVDEYQIFEAKVLGASAVLLICALLDEERLKRYRKIAESLGMSALVEAHTEEEAEMAVRSGARIVGVNNRNLKTFHVDNEISTRLRRLIPPELVFVSESGVQGRDDVKAAEQSGADAVLMGEILMRSRDKKKMIMVLKGEGQEQ
ncbi:indole-3-glycerol phosphate synthase TrpC [Clostridium sp. AM58-1XD]|uniref:indole-3-glycerol phosphate synthase TrpC n=1 Tax=Clostridium sp. AM58-1XD TaxID=2292307 RepID=UPI0015F5678D|nr:indole-3-glycerol phosphate synthase TrpC [Clostridium sp. AM58-1XD]